MNSSLRTVLCVLEKVCTVVIFVAALVYMEVLSISVDIDVFLRDVNIMAPVLLGMLLLGSFLQKFPKMVHRRRIPAFVYYFLAVLVILFVFLTPWVIGMYIAGVGLLLVSLWNFVLEQKFSKRNIKTIKV